MTVLTASPTNAGSTETAVGVTATLTSSASILSCAACCVLPLALPAAALAGAGATLSWFESASPWLRAASLVIVLVAWWMVWWQSARTGKSAARSTIILIGIATVLTIFSLLWEPFIEGPLIQLLR